LAWRNNWPTWEFIEDDDLAENDAVVISLPFSDTGNKHEKLNWLLTQCDQLKIPVLVDCAYFGVCANIDFNFNYDCITDVVFSLSKTFPVAHARIGIRLTRVDDDDLMFVYDKINYNNRIGAKLGLELIKNYGPDYIYDTYVNQQKTLCSKLTIESSNTVLFGIDLNNRYPEYNRGTSTNRLGLYKHYAI
jgi:histidinol-phosphate/aromatic aminotransferase/cobyric acid decarboxylase-like protein